MFGGSSLARADEAKKPAPAAEESAPAKKDDHGHDHGHAHDHDHDHDHASHDHASHDHAEDHSGHDHAAHDHAGHDHVHHDHEHGDSCAHHHAAPNGGSLVALGDHFAHLEMLLDAETGTLTAYVLDGEAEKSIRLKQEAIEVSVMVGPDRHLVTLGAVENVLTGETVGDSSEFRATVAALKGQERFAGQVKALSVRGQALKDVAFLYPEGNE